LIVKVAHNGPARVEATIIPVAMRPFSKISSAASSFLLVWLNPRSSPRKRKDSIELDTYPFIEVRPLIDQELLQFREWLMERYGIYFRLKTVTEPIEPRREPQCPHMDLESHGVLLRYQIPVIVVRLCGEQDPLLNISHEVVLEKRNRDPCAGT